MSMFQFLEEQLDSWNITLSGEQKNQLLGYYELLFQYNQVMNLTAITEWEEVCTKHFLDSAALLQFNKEDMTGKNLIDIGTGAGFPGLVLKILKPELNVILLDALTKRVKFLNNVIGELKLSNPAIGENVSRETFSNHTLNILIDKFGGCVAIHGRAEEVAFLKNGKKMRQSTKSNQIDSNTQEVLSDTTGDIRLPFGAGREQFDICTARAVCDLRMLTEYALPLLKVGGIFYAYKANDTADEISNAKRAIELTGGTLADVKRYDLPGTDIHRSMICIQKVNDTPDKYPRTGALIQKRAL